MGQNGPQCPPPGGIPVAPKAPPRAPRVPPRLPPRTPESGAGGGVACGGGGAAAVVDDYDHVICQNKLLCARRNNASAPDRAEVGDLLLLKLIHPIAERIPIAAHFS